MPLRINNAIATTWGKKSDPIFDADICLKDNVEVYSTMDSTINNKAEYRSTSLFSCNFISSLQ